MPLRALTRFYLVTLLLALALLAPVAYALFVNHGTMVRYWGAATLVAIWATQYVSSRRAVRSLPIGDPSRGLLVFVEGVAFLGIRWAIQDVLAATQLTAFPGQIEICEWSRGWRGAALLPDLMDSRRNREHGRQLAARLADYAAQHPGAPIEILTCSSGGFIALEAMKALPPGLRVRRLLLLTSTVSHGYDLSAALARCDAIVNVYSRFDLFVNGLGPLLFGTNDGPHTLPAGTVGFSGAGQPNNLRQVPWTPRFIRLGWIGDHMTGLSPRFVEWLLNQK
jgi:hypothetical protein